jgi:hypothetical protein
MTMPSKVSQRARLRAVDTGRERPLRVGCGAFKR